MKRNKVKIILIAITVIYFITVLGARAQLTDSLLISFYNRTLTLYFDQKTNGKFSCTIIETSFDTTHLIKSIGEVKLRYNDPKISIIGKLDRPLKKNKGRSIYGIGHETYGQDTVEVNIGGSTIGNLNRKAISLSLWCGGTMGHIPAGRFVYDRINKSWIFISGNEILEAKMAELKREKALHDKE